MYVAYLPILYSCFCDLLDMEVGHILNTEDHLNLPPHKCCSFGNRICLTDPETKYKMTKNAGEEGCVEEYTIKL